MSNDGPSPETIQHLAGMMPSMIQGIRQKTIGGKGVKLLPTSVCPICGKAHNYASFTQRPALPIEAQCDSCKALLETNTCLKAEDGRYAFLSTPVLKVGVVVAVTDEQMDRIFRSRRKRRRSNKPKSP